MRKNSLSVLYPTPKEMDDRMSFIVNLRGKAPHLYDLWMAAIEQELGQAIEENREFNWGGFDPIVFLMRNSVSLGREGRKEAVEISRVSASPEKKVGWWARLRGKE